MKTPIKSFLLALLLALVASACSQDPSVDSLPAVAQSNASATEVPAPTSEPTPSSEPAAETELVAKADTDAVMAIFSDLAARYPGARSGEDIAAGGRCPFGDQYGVLFIETAQILCFVESTYEVYGISPNPLATTFSPGEFVSQSDDTGTIMWNEIGLDGESFVFVEQIVDDLSVYSAQAVRDEFDAESLATALHHQLEESVGDRIRSLAKFELTELIDRGQLDSGIAVSTAESAIDTDSITATFVESVDGLQSGLSSPGPGGPESLFVSLTDDAGTLLFESVEVEVGAISFNRIHEGGTARDTDDIHLAVDFVFDRGHNFEPANFVIVAADGTEYPAAPDQIVALDGVTLTFPVDDDVMSLSGWQLQLVRGDDSTSIDL